MPGLHPDLQIILSYGESLGQYGQRDEYPTIRKMYSAGLDKKSDDVALEWSFSPGWLLPCRALHVRTRRKLKTVNVGERRVGSTVLMWISYYPWMEHASVDQQ
jgi:hypothetical protein